jgi:hypothetical protein
MLNTVDPDMRFAWLKGLYRCTLPSGTICNIAFVRTCKLSRWRPQTPWKDATIVQEGDLDFFDVHYLIRGALLVNTDLFTEFQGKRKVFFVHEIDEDMFLCLGN